MLEIEVGLGLQIRKLIGIQLITMQSMVMIKEIRYIEVNYNYFGIPVD